MSREVTWSYPDRGGLSATRTSFLDPDSSVHASVMLYVGYNEGEVPSWFKLFKIVTYLRVDCHHLRTRYPLLHFPVPFCVGDQSFWVAIGHVHAQESRLGSNWVSWHVRYAMVVEVWCCGNLELGASRRILPGYGAAARGRRTAWVSSQLLVGTSRQVQSHDARVVFRFY